MAIGACVYYKDCALRVDSMKQGVVTRVEVIKICSISIKLLRVKKLSISGDKRWKLCGQ